VSHAFSSGFHFDGNYTWGKGINNTNPTVDQGSIGNAASDWLNLKNNLVLDSYDVKHRFNGVFLADLPFGEGKALDMDNRVYRALLSGWQAGGTIVLQTGMPFQVSGCTDGSLIARPDRVEGVPVEAPKELQRWYDGNTTVTLPNGRKITPQKNTYLKYYSGAFSGRVVRLPNGNWGADQNWVGYLNPSNEAWRGPGRFNMDLSLRRSIRLRERVSLEIAAEASNLINNTQLNGNYSGALGNTVVTPNAAQGTQAGMGSSDTFGTIALVSAGWFGTTNNVYAAREVVMNLRIRF
jgi:hypothetical protein